MTDLKDKVVLVTGASSGIGAAIVKILLQEGMKVVGVARRVEKVEELGKGFEGKLFALKADVTNKADLEFVFNWMQKNVGPIEVLVNNAGISCNKPIAEFDTEDSQKIINTNLLAVIWYTSKAIKAMKENGINGSIININSVAGHYIIKGYPGTSVYQASKYGITGFTECIRTELAETGSKIRITSVSPGLVESEMTVDFLDKTPYIKSEDVANTVKFILTQPPEVQIAELIIRPTGEFL